MKNRIVITLFAISVLFATGCRELPGNQEYLRKVLDKLESIESATYYLVSEGWQPGDTSPAVIDVRRYFEYLNIADTTIGAGFVSFEKGDTTLIISIYDGNMQASFFHEHNGVLIDSFKVWSQPFRPVNPPFFSYAASILKYALETNDSIVISFEDSPDSLFVSLVIHEERQVEFFGKEYYMPENPYNPGETTSRYQIWIDKTVDLPFRVRREMSHDISVRAVRDVELNNLSIDEFKAADLLPPSYEIREYIRGQKATPARSQEGRVAPDWVLNDAEGAAIALNDLQSKVLLLNFTGIGCGPCQASIPFLKELVDDLHDSDFNLIAIETWARRGESLKNYSARNGLNYTLLIATDEVVKKYETNNSVPVFFILDKQRIIRKVIRGYSPATTGKEIRQAIAEIL